MLESYGYTVLAAVDGIEALALAAAYPGAIDVLLSDFVMPRMSGREPADRLLVARAGVAESGVGFIQKPFEADELGVAIRRVLDAVAG